MIEVSWALFETIVLKKLGVAMKVIFGLLVSLSVMLSGCGGGGSSGGTTTSSTFNLAQGLANFAKTGSTNTFNISGTCAGKFLFVIDPATSTSTPEGDTKFVAKTTTNFTFNAPCSFGGGAGTPRTQAKDTGAISYDKNYVQASADNGSYDVIREKFIPPTSVRIGDTGSYTVDEYYDSTKKDRIGEILFTYVVKSDTQSSVKYELTGNQTFSSGIGSDVTSNKSIFTYRLDANGQMTLLSFEISATFKPGTGVNYQFIAN